MKKSIEKTLYVLTPLVVFVLASSVLNFIDRFVLNYISMIGQGSYEFLVNYGTVISTFLSMVNVIIELFIMYLLMKRDGAELSIWDYLNMNGLSFYRTDRLHSYTFSWIMVAIVGISGSIGLNILISLSGLTEISQGYSQASASLYSAPAWIGLPYVVIFSPLIEEMVYRLLIYGRLKRNFPVWLAMIVSSLFFGIMHGNLVQGIYAFLMGMFMCLAVEYTHSLAGSFVMHALANMFIYLLSYSGLLLKMNNIGFCILFLTLTALSLAVQIVFSVKSVKKFGIPDGVAPVGCFYID